MSTFASKRGRSKRKSEQESHSLLNYFGPSSSEIPPSKFVRQIVNDIVDLSVNEVEKKTKKHGWESVSDKTVQLWKVKFPWLVVMPEPDRRLKCSICTEQHIRSIWADEGSANVQKNSIQRHADSTDHRKAEAQACATPILESDIPVEDHDVSADDLKLFRTITYMAKEELPSSKLNSLLELQNMNGNNIKYQNISWDTITDIQSCISDIIQRDIVQDIIQSDVYAIMIDESTDLAIQKHLSICVRYVKDGEPVTRFLSNVAVEDGKAHTIVAELIQCLTKLGLDPTKSVSLATDGASTMMGRKTGVGVQMKTKHSPFVVQTHCIAHRLNLAVTDSIKKEDILVKFREKFSALYHFMSGSSNRTTTLKNIQKVLEEPELTIKEPHSIRWLGLKRAVEAVNDSYSSVLATLSKYAAEKQAVANGLLKYFATYKTCILVAFMMDVHETLAIFSIQLQKQNISFSEVQPLMDAVIAKLDFLESNDGNALKAMKDRIELKDEDEGTHAYLNGEKLTRYSDNVKGEIVNLRSRYTTCLKKNIKARLKKEDSEIFRHLSQLVEPAVVNCSEEDCCEALEAIGSLYGEDKVTRIVHGDLISGTTEEETKVPKLLDKAQLQQEWPMLKGMISGSYKKLSTQHLCKRVIQLHKDVLPAFSKVCTIALSIAMTSVECERSFSTQNRIKCKYRSSLKAENLDSLITIQMDKTSLSSYSPSKAVKLWISKKKRRKARLCQEYRPRAKKSKQCLMTDDVRDMLNPAVMTAILRLPDDVKQQRDFRLMRAVQLSAMKRVLPKEEWTIQEDDERYLLKGIAQAQGEIDEKQEYETLNLSYKI